MKLYDFDSMFEEKLSDYIQKNMSKHTEEEWEDLIPKMYQKFADTVLDEIKMTPTDYYLSMTNDELIETLKEHLKQDIPVSDILCTAIEVRKCTDQLVKLLDEKEEPVLHYTINLLGSEEKAFDKYIEILQREETDDDIGDMIIDALKEKADIVKDRALNVYKTDKKLAKAMLEVLSKTTARDEEIYNILVKEFRQNLEDIPMYASFLGDFGDERALPILMNEIDRNDINYVEFQELVYAIEKLGGEYTKQRDFSNDPFYKTITSGVNQKLFKE